jgi:hypothetical protein
MASKIEVSWYNDEQTVLYFDFHGKWGWDDLREAQEISDDILTTVQHPVNMIMHVKNRVWLPANFLGNVPWLMRRVELHPKVNHLIVVGVGSLIVEAFYLVCQAYRLPHQRYHFVSGLSDADHLLGDLS